MPSQWQRTNTESCPFYLCTCLTCFKKIQIPRGLKLHTFQRLFRFQAVTLKIIAAPPKSSLNILNKSFGLIKNQRSNTFSVVNLECWVQHMLAQCPCLALITGWCSPPTLSWPIWALALSQLVMTVMPAASSVTLFPRVTLFLFKSEISGAL